MQKDNGIPIESDRDLLIKLATDVRYIREAIDEVKETVGGHDTRISKLEQWRAYILGFSAAVAFIISIIVSSWRG
jgi:ribosomal 50S subunit-associated protein YjgA (DUF615 family)